MNHFFLLAMVIMTVLSSAYAETRIEVSPEGKFYSLAQARNEIRKLKKSGEQGPFTVVVRQGNYLVDKSIAFGPQDAGTTYRCAENERARFFGGKIIAPGWFEPVTDKGFLSQLVDQTVKSKIRVANLKKHGIVDYGEISRHGWAMEPKDRVPPATLNIDGQRMTLARWPNTGEENPYMVYNHYLAEDRPLRGYELTVQAIIDKVRLPGDVTLTGVIDPGGEYNRGGKGGTFEVAFDRMKYWHDIENIFLDGVIASTWEWTYNRLASVDVAKRQITLTSPELHGIAQGASVRLPHFYFENIPEEIDRPGEYYIDRKNGLLYLYPPKKSGTIVLSTLEAAMVSIMNSSDLRFQGLEFDTGRHLGFDIRNSKDITVDSCRIANFTAGGLNVDGKNIRILNSHIHGMGAFGVHLNGGNFRTLEPANNEVLNCHIHDFGWEQKSQLPGVIVNGVGHRIAHNEIHDGPHFAIRVKRANDVLIEYNEIYDLPKYHKFDGGSLYVFSGDRAESRGTVIRGNYFHDIPTIGVYPDNFTWGVEISHNLFRNVGVTTDRYAVHVNGGGECRTFNNMMVDCVLMYGQGARDKEERWFKHWNKTLEKFGDGKVEQTPYNKYEDFKEWLKKKDKDDFFRPGSKVYNNVLYHPNHEIFQAMTRDKKGKLVNTKAIDKQGIRDNSGKLYKKNNRATTKDPGFVDYAAGDFRLRKNAPVFRMVRGFEPIPFGKMGRKDERMK